MSDINALTLTQKAWEEISHHGVETFPEECCGVILHNGGVEAARRRRKIKKTLPAPAAHSYPPAAPTTRPTSPRKIRPAPLRSENPLSQRAPISSSRSTIEWSNGSPPMPGHRKKRISS